MAQTGDERRREYREMEEVSIFLETAAPMPGEDAIGSVALCGSLDISPTGLRMKLDQSLAQFAILQLGIQFADKRRFHLVGEVRWVKDCDEGYEVGFEILESEQTDFTAWQTLFDEESSAEG
ncbi:MAG: PilZ domain-containing protein [Gammaproteobacteria bacterium]|nr:PilZ domain-containing protein [Gammaproteobacteria bacterium]